MPDDLQVEATLVTPLTAYRLTKPDGHDLFCVYGHTSWEQSLALVVMPPGYERRIHHYGVFAEYLLRHGFDVLRFDLSNHIGLSDGEIVDFTMTSLADDIGVILAHAAELKAELPTCLVGTSLAARAAVRAAVTVQDETGQSPSALVTILPVVDVESTTTQAIGRNIVNEWRTGAVTDPTLVGRVLSHDVAWAFAQDAYELAWGGIESTRDELVRLECDALAIAAAEDSWVQLDDVESAFADSTLRTREVVVLEAASHELSVNAPVVRLLMNELISWLWSRHGHSGDVEHLDFQEVVAVIDRERALKLDRYERITKGAP